MSSKESYNGKITETLAEVFFKRHDYLVQKYGVEHQIVMGIDLIKSTKAKNDHVKNMIRKYITMPDFVVMSLNKEEALDSIFFIDVKFKEFKNNEDFKKSLQEGEHLNKEANKYKDLWDGSVFIFLIVKIDKNIRLYYDSANYICGKKFIRPLTKENHFWIKEKELATMQDNITRFYG